MEVLNTKRIIRLGMMMTILAISLTGCSGIRVNQSISPATFLLPGLLGEHDAMENGTAPLVARHSP
tara:strand:- start:165 stop:362 length:198 start_codon:yes stop_codon:yes gene_type:complete